MTDILLEPSILTLIFSAKSAGNSNCELLLLLDLELWATIGLAVSTADKNTGDATPNHSRIFPVKKAFLCDIKQYSF